MLIVLEKNEARVFGNFKGQLHKYGAQGLKVSIGYQQMLHRRSWEFESNAAPPYALRQRVEDESSRIKWKTKEYALQRQQDSYFTPVYIRSLLNPTVEKGNY